LTASRFARRHRPPHVFFVAFTALFLFLALRRSARTWRGIA
jgi:hypothetical protein